MRHISSNRSVTDVWVETTTPTKVGPVNSSTENRSRRMTAQDRHGGVIRSMDRYLTDVSLPTDRWSSVVRT